MSSSIIARGVQFYKDRFPTHDLDDEGVPNIATWRCNLTGLSHVYNLYFVAYVDCIYVYEPQFPNHNLPPEPSLIIATEALCPIEVTRSSPFRIRGIDTQSANRAINRLLVQFLGDEEVVAVVREDGDVEAYHTRHVHQAIEKRAQLDTTLDVFASDVKPYFHRHVGHSTWGLAIHTEARMIAVSSNSFMVTIFTFALTQDGPDKDDERASDGDGSSGEEADDEEYYYCSTMHERPLNDRKQSDVRVLLNGGANIPDIAFCNTGDPTGRWLLTADIANNIRTWDVHSMSLVQENRTALKPSFHAHSRHDPKNACWGILTLDPMSFRLANSMQEAFGTWPDDPPIDKRSEMWDMSLSVNHIKGVREPFRNVNRPAEVLNGNYANPLATPRQAAERSIGAQRSAASSNSEGESESDDDGPLYQELVPQLGAQLQAELLRQQHHHLRGPEITFTGEQALCGNLPCPIMRLSCKDMYLYQPSPNNRAMENLPVAAFGDIFEQRLNLILERDNGPGMDRINLHAQIPSLGVVIIASQKGRVAILTLTQFVTELPEYKASGEHWDTGNNGGGMRFRRLYGCRVDHVLPLAGQEAAGHRPKAALHGIAVGPVQGTEHLEDGLKRWRLMVMYQDHAVLSYEIGRPRGEALGLDLMAL